MPVVDETPHGVADDRDVSPAAILRLDPGVVWTAVGHEIVVYRLNPPTSFVLDATAGLIWRCLDGASPVGEILADLADVVGEDLGRVWEDCAPALTLWLKQQLVEDVTGG